MQSQQLLMESQVLKDEVLMGAESAEQPAEEMSERHNHVKNLTETSRNSALCQVIHFAGVRRFGEAQYIAERTLASTLIAVAVFANSRQLVRL